MLSVHRKALNASSNLPRLMQAQEDWRAFRARLVATESNGAAEPATSNSLQRVRQRQKKIYRRPKQLLRQPTA